MKISEIVAQSQIEEYNEGMAVLERENRSHLEVDLWVAEFSNRIMEYHELGDSVVWWLNKDHGIKAQMTGLVGKIEISGYEMFGFSGPIVLSDLCQYNDVWIVRVNGIRCSAIGRVVAGLIVGYGG
jgi:hypothetical protein